MKIRVSTRSLGIVTWSAATLLFLVVALIVAIESALHFSGVPIDGPFQLYNALRRIAAGFRPGIDFQFFHGLGLPYLYYGLFRLFGAGLRGSELSRNLVSPILFTLVTVAFFRAFTNTWTRTMYATATVLALAFTVKLSGAFFALVFAINGMLGVRSTMPILLPVVLHLARTRGQRIIGAGVVLGLAAFYGTEQSLAAVFAFLIVSAIAVARRKTRIAQVGEACATVAVMLLGLVAALTTVAGWSGMRAALHYNFSIIPAEQYWFFGAPPNIFVPSWGAAPRMILGSWQIALGIVLVIVANVVYIRRLVRNPDGEAGALYFSLAVLPMYGAVSLASLLGVFTPVYAQPCWRTLVLIGVLEWLAFCDRHAARSTRAFWLGVPRPAALASATIALGSIITVPLVRTSLGGSLFHVLRAHVAGHSRFEAGGIWPVTLAEGQAVIDSYRRPDGSPPLLWSTYAGWIEAKNGAFNPSFDYMIHALGPDNRADYVRRFNASKPALVQSVLPTFTQYEPWLENTNWAFYAQLLTWYDVVATTPWSIYWARRSAPAPEAELIGEMQVPAGMSAVPLPPIPIDNGSSTLGLLEVEAEYAIRNPLHWLPVIGNTPRYLVVIDGAVSRVPVSIDPFVEMTRFPIVVRAGQRPTLYFTTQALFPGASFAPQRLRLFIRHITPRNQVWLENLATRGGLH